MSKISMSKIQRLQAERIDCIKMAGNYQTSFQHSLVLFQRADELKNEMLEILKNVNKKAAPKVATLKAEHEKTI